MKKPVVILVGGIVVLLIIFLVVFVFWGNSGKNPASNNSNNYKVETTISPQQTIPGATETNTYNTPYYQLSYPKTMDIKPLESGGAILAGELFSDNANNVNIDISVFSGQDIMGKIAQLAQGMGYTRKDIKIGDLSAVSYSGVIKGAQVYEQIVMIQKGPNVIKAQMMQGKGPTQAGLDEFSSVLNSLK